MTTDKPKKSQRKSEAIAAYRRTDKGKESQQAYENSPKGKRRKRDWRRKNINYAKARRQQQFIDTYGQPEQALAMLSTTEQQVLSLFYGLDDGTACTLEEIAIQLDLSSKQNVGRIKSKALQKITDNRDRDER